ncbi:helix-turn-helix transcriptional regulator [Nocardia iowensis]|uniref:LuxR C-terminal-related transcriptional regulator n=1 Tax=Nocardia iowensis TaxID=204891 RepID=A0ABX8RYG3_NOCIO|nr:AAA family ATPase [Nocardia iowensis]QXN94705.1 LuxR C-terminal-related transcriptional regulator [Nocardia iowensis]
MTVRPSLDTGSLPASTSDFVGRERELAKIAALLLNGTRLITLIGSGGIGKTRLATEAVQRYHRARRVPVYWVRLARLAKDSDASEVEDELAQAIVDADFSGRSAWAALVDTLTRTDAVGRKLQSVLVMDNCEHVLAGAGQLIADLLAAVPHLTVVATSREAIGWVDEQLVAVPSLPREQALALFRARAELTGLPVADDQLELAEAICRHVHNHPLYIRLAAARLLRQPLSRILQDLSGEATDRRLRWSNGPRVGADERHRGIRDVIAWSFDLCRDKERLLFERMSVFAAGYDIDPDDSSPSLLEVGAELAAIEGVCADLDDTGDPAVRIARDEVEDLLERLAAQSLVTVHMSATTVRYSLLESFRVFAQQRLCEREGGQEWVQLTARHRRYYRDKVLEAQANWYSPAEQELLDWARASWGNLHSAIDGSLATPGDAAIGLEIAIGLIALRAPFFRGSLRESRRWAERTLAATRDQESAPLELQITAMALISWISRCQGVHEDADRMLDACVAASLPDAAAGFDWRLTPESELGLPAPVEFACGSELLLVQQDPRAVTVFARSREKFAARGDLGGTAMSELFEALAAGFLGTSAQALDIARRHLDNAAASGAGWAKSWAELAWTIALTKHGDPNEALAVGRTALANQLVMHDQWGALWAIHIRTWTLARMVARAQAEQARLGHAKAWATEIAQLIGGVATLRRKLGVNLANLAPFATETDEAVATARSVLGAADYAVAEREGSLLHPEHDEVARLALGTLVLDELEVDHPVRRHRPSPWHELSVAEQDVAILAAAGWTNTAIAARRGSSFKTVNAQMVSIFQKLMINSRADIAAFVPAERRGDVASAVASRPKQR